MHYRLQKIFSKKACGVNVPCWSFTLKYWKVLFVCLFLNSHEIVDVILTICIFLRHGLTLIHSLTLSWSSKLKIQIHFNLY